MQFLACEFPTCERHLFRSWQLVLLGSLLLLISATGCKKPSGKASVHGRVTFRGQPLESASLTFIPAIGRPQPASILNGEYTTELSPGEYTAVVIVGADLPKGYKEGDPVPPPKISLPDAYASPAKSPLKATVKPGQSEPIDFELK